MIIKAHGSDGSELVQMKVQVPKRIKDALRAIRRLEGRNYSEVTREALQSHLEGLGVLGGGVAE